MLSWLDERQGLRRFVDLAGKVDGASSEAAEEAFKAFLRETTLVELQVRFCILTCIPKVLTCTCSITGAEVQDDPHCPNKGAAKLCAETGAAACPD